MTAHIHYFTLHDEQRREEKLDWFRETSFRDIPFQRIHPDAKHNWLDQTDNDFDTLLPLIDKEAKAGRTEQALFKLFSRGVATQRDEWVYDFSAEHLAVKMRYFTEVYQQTVLQPDNSDKMSIKWDRELEDYRKRNIEKDFDKSNIIPALYRPFLRQSIYFDRHFNGMTYQWFDVLRPSLENKTIGFISGISKPFSTLVADTIVDLNCISPAAGGTQCLPLYRYDKDGVRHDNITDWGLAQFRERYGSPHPACGHPLPGGEGLKEPLSPRERGRGEGGEITKPDIFHYVYAVLHNPTYRKKYELNLKRDFPRIPLYDDFHQWAEWGRALMDLHLNYETAEPYQLERTESANEPVGAIHELPLHYVSQGASHAPLQLFHEPSPTYTKVPKAKLKADKEQGRIIIDELTILSGVPACAWEYRLDNRSALEWILDQYKEKKPSDPTIREKFNTYRFADYKERVIDLLRRVCTVSVKTMEIVNRMA